MGCFPFVLAPKAPIPSIIYPHFETFGHDTTPSTIHGASFASNIKIFSFLVTPPKSLRKNREETPGNQREVIAKKETRDRNKHMERQDNR
jgi:hypothetical protein